MQNILRSVGETILIIIRTIHEYISDYNKIASDRCKLFTLIAFLFALFFIGVDIYELHLNNISEQKILETADKVFDSPITLIDNMDEQSKVILTPIKNMFTDIKPLWIKLSVLITSVLIMILISYIKKPVEYFKEKVYEGIVEYIEEPMMWIPFGILTTIDIVSLVLSFL